MLHDPAPVRQPGGFGWKPGKGTNPGAYPVAPLLRAAPKPSRGPTRRTRLWWAQGWWGNQGETSMCAIYSWLHALADGPVTHPAAPKPLCDPVALYQEAQRLDGTPVTAVDSGLSSDAAAKAVRNRGWIGTYHWAADVDEVVDALLTLGPVVLGMNWRADMNDPGQDGNVRYSGPVLGGHQVVLDGVDTRSGERWVRGKNSWGRGWGARGYFYLPIDDLARAMDEGAEACVAVEARF